MGLRPIQVDENRFRQRYVGHGGGTGEVVTALDVLRP